MSANHERSKRIKDLCNRALDLDSSERPIFLQESCGEDESLRREVMSLLIHRQSVELFLAKPAWEHVVHDLITAKTESLSGRQLGRYVVHEQLGKGGMGQVWRAIDSQLKRDVAIKILPAEFSSQPDRVRRFEQEAFAISALNHPNIITIHEVGQCDGLHFIVTELVQGETLRERLAAGAIGWRESVRIAAQIASGLSVAHAAGIIHRDIKPENVIVQPDGHVKVLDFGIAKWVKTATPSEHGAAGQGLDTRLGATPGTLKYMSPEQGRGERLDARTDVFSLGLVLYEMIAGRHPYDHLTEDQLVEALQSNEEIPPVSDHARTMPTALVRILSRALHRQPANRYASAAEMLADLSDVKSLIEVSRQEQGQQLFRVRNANQLLTQFAVLFDVDKHTRIPLNTLWTIWRYADLKRGPLEAETFRRSLVSGVLKISLLAFIVACATIAVAAFKSVNDSWSEKIMRDGHTAAARCAVFSPDGRQLVSVGEDHQIIVWDFARRERIKTLTDHTAPVNTVAFSADGKWFATGSDDKSVIVWDAVRLEKVAVLQDHQSPVNAIAFSPDSKFLFSGSLKLMVSEVGSWRKIREYEWGISYGNLIFLPKGSLIDNFGRQWDLNTGQLVRDIDSNWMSNWAAVSPDAKRWVGVDTFGNVKFVDLEQQRLLNVQHAHFDHGRSVAFSPDGKWVATAAERVLLWDAAAQTKIAPLEYESIVWSVAFSPNGRWLVTTHGDGAILVWDVLQHERVANLREHSGGVRAAVFSPDGKRVATASEDQSVIIWDAQRGDKEAVLLGHHSRVTAVTFSPDNRWVVSADQDGLVIRWNVEQRLPQMTINRPRGVAYCIAISPDGHFIATTHGVYESESGKMVVNLADAHGTIYGTAFTPDGRKLVCVTDHCTVLVFDTADWQMIGEQRWAERPLIALSVSRDGKYIVTGDDEAVVRLGMIEPLQQLAVLGKHDARIKSVAFSVDAATVVSAGDDKMISLWDVGKRQLITHIGTHTSPVYAVAFSPDGTQLVSAEHDRSVRLYTRQRTLWGFRLS